jgi:hypothetical protein
MSRLRRADARRYALRGDLSEGRRFPAWSTGCRCSTPARHRSRTMCPGDFRARRAGRGAAEERLKQIADYHDARKTALESGAITGGVLQAAAARGALSDARRTGRALRGADGGASRAVSPPDGARAVVSMAGKPAAPSPPSAPTRTPMSSTRWWPYPRPAKAGQAHHRRRLHRRLASERSACSRSWAEGMPNRSAPCARPMALQWRRDGAGRARRRSRASRRAIFA